MSPNNPYRAQLDHPFWKLSENLNREMDRAYAALKKPSPLQTPGYTRGYQIGDA